MKLQQCLVCPPTASEDRKLLMNQNCVRTPENVDVTHILDVDDIFKGNLSTDQKINVKWAVNDLRV